MDWMLFAIFLAACATAGITGAVFSPGEWYRNLDKPDWTPPDWVFPVAWTTLYLLMAFAGARAAANEAGGYATALWSLQIAFNTLWTPIFFGLRRLRLAFGIIIGLWLSVFATTIALFQVDTWAGLAFVPYLVWVSIAGALNYSVWKRNPDSQPLDMINL